VNQAESQMEEHADKIDDDSILDSVDAAIEELEESKEEAEEVDDLEEATEKIEEAVEELQTELQEIGKEIYGDQAGGPGGAGFDPSNMSEEDLKQAAQNMGGGAPGAENSEDVVDADYEEVDTDQEEGKKE